MQHATLYLIIITYPSSEQALSVLIALNLNGSLQADELCGAESIEDLLCCGSIVGVILKTVVDQILHVGPRRTTIVLNVIDGSPLVIVHIINKKDEENIINSTSMMNLSISKPAASSSNGL